MTFISRSEVKKVYFMIDKVRNEIYIFSSQDKKISYYGICSKNSNTILILFSNQMCYQGWNSLNAYWKSKQEEAI